MNIKIFRISRFPTLNEIFFVPIFVWRSYILFCKLEIRIVNLQKYGYFSEKYLIRSTTGKEEDKNGPWRKISVEIESTAREVVVTMRGRQCSNVREEQKQPWNRMLTATTCYNRESYRKTEAAEKSNHFPGTEKGFAIKDVPGIMIIVVICLLIKRQSYPAGRSTPRRCWMEWYI